MTIEDCTQSRLNRSKRHVPIQDGFRDIAGYDQAGRTLRILVNEGKLMKMGHSVYAKVHRDITIEKITPAAPGGPAAVVIKALKRLNIRYRLAGVTGRYNKGQSIRIPISLRVKTPSRSKGTLMVGKSKINA